MKKMLVLLGLITLGFGCRKCLNCPDNLVNIDGKCVCESEVYYREKCIDNAYLNANYCLLHDTSQVCENFEMLKEIIMVRVYPDFWNPRSYAGQIQFFSPLNMVSYYLYNAGQDSLNAWSDLGEVSSGIQNWHKLGFPEFKKEIDGEECLLRCNVKRVSDIEVKIYFYWITYHRQIKGECVRNFKLAF